MSDSPVVVPGAASNLAVAAVETHLKPRVHLVLVAVDAHAVANGKRVDFFDVAQRSRGQDSVQPPCEGVGVLFENLGCTKWTRAEAQ